MKAIIGWKSTENGDPLMDVAYFLAMFLQPANYGYEYLQDLDQLMGKCFTSRYGCILLVIICANKVSPMSCGHAAGYPNRYTPSEDMVLEAYCTEAKHYGFSISLKAFNYAKAVTCLRLVTRVQVITLSFV